MHGIDISRQRSRRITAADFHQYDHIYAMAQDVIDDMRRIARKDFDERKVSLLLNELHPGRNLDIPDPWYGGEDGYHEVFELIDRACDALLEKVKSGEVKVRS